MAVEKKVRGLERELHNATRQNEKKALRFARRACENQVVSLEYQLERCGAARVSNSEVTKELALRLRVLAGKVFQDQKSKAGGQLKISGVEAPNISGICIPTPQLLSSKSSPTLRHMQRPESTRGGTSSGVGRRPPLGGADEQAWAGRRGSAANLPPLEAGQDSPQHSLQSPPLSGRVSPLKSPRQQQQQQQQQPQRQSQPQSRTKSASFFRKK